MVLLIIIGYFIGNIHYFQTNPDISDITQQTQILVIWVIFPMKYLTQIGYVPKLGRIFANILPNKWPVLLEIPAPWVALVDVGARFFANLRGSLQGGTVAPLTRRQSP